MKDFEDSLDLLEDDGAVLMIISVRPRVKEFTRSFVLQD